MSGAQAFYTVNDYIFIDLIIPEHIFLMKNQKVWAIGLRKAGFGQKKIIL